MAKTKIVPRPQADKLIRVDRATHNKLASLRKLYNRSMSEIVAMAVAQIEAAPARAAKRAR